MIVGGVASAAAAYVWWCPFLGFTDVLPRVLIAFPWFLPGAVAVAGLSTGSADATLVFSALAAGAVALMQYALNWLFGGIAPNQLARALLMGGAPSVVFSM